MISFERACEIAFEHFEQSVGVTGISRPYDIDDAWVFSAGRESDSLVGIQGIAVVKEDGSIRAFNLPNMKNFALLEAGVAMDLPERYR